MRLFTKSELTAVIFTFIILFTFSYINFQASLRRARDSQRRDDLGTIYNALGEFQTDFGFYPPASTDGRIIACKGDNFDSVIQKLKTLPEFDLQVYLTGLKPCDWGWDSLSEFSEGKTYLKTISSDPHHSLGVRYFYISNLNRFQIYSYLEGEKGEQGYNQGIVDRTIYCGNKICSFGRASGITPLEKSLEEYENELLLTPTP